MNKAVRIRVLLADDHAVVRAGFRRLLESSPDIEVVAEADSGEQAYLAYTRERPDIVVLDLAMPGIGGLAALSRIRAQDANARILVLSVHEDALFTTRALAAGALGYVSKRAVPEVLVEAVRAVAAGRQFLEREIAQGLALARTRNEPVQTLTEREFDVFRLLASGKNVNEIADLLHISPKTAGTHQTAIYRKLGVSNAAQLTRLALNQGIALD